MTKLVLDTNVLIYALDALSEFHARSVQILTNEEIELFVTTKSVSEYFAVCSKLKLDPVVVFGFYEDLKRNVTLLFPTLDSVSRLEELLRQYQPHGSRVYDFEIVSVMVAHGIQAIATFNVGDFKSIREVEIFQHS